MQQRRDKPLDRNDDRPPFNKRKLQTNTKLSTPRLASSLQ